jgi:hypothetical protein
VVRLLIKEVEGVLGFVARMLNKWMRNADVTGGGVIPRIYIVCMI